MAFLSVMDLPPVPAKHADFIPYIQAHPDKPVAELLEPYKQYDAKLREIYAQEPSHPALNNHFINTVPIFASHEADVKIRARDLDSETADEKEKYLMPLKDEDRKENGSPAIVKDLKTFQQNLAVFSESSLVDLDWNNVVAAGSSVVTSLLPVPEKYNGSKRALRQYYHEIVAPASDVDLFLYGLTEEEAVKKIIQIETKIRDSILTETTTIRTKNTITIASQYPTRHVQIVLRIYKSVSEILTGFDVDCSCAAYDGKQVYASPRAILAYMTQRNTIDLSRRSPSYENRLSKYSHRGFEVYWPLLDRSKIDPTIFERSFARTVGLARLLVLEKLPKSSDRDSYMDQRRRERGRPSINRYSRFARRIGGNIKEDHEDEVAEWVEQEEVSDYSTFTIPYGEKFHAKKIEKLLYTKDLLLNAEWNKPEDRQVNLHRHPAFFGYAEDVIHDCCGYCPQPITPEEEDAAQVERKIYVSGEISFIKDDAGRQAIGSFNPITDDDWTEMAYVGNTTRLCQAIADSDLEHVQDWLSQEGSDPNCRDYTGRTPLHLAVTSSSPEIVQCLVDHGARLVARLADGRTALHLAAARGNVEMVKIILQKSEQNEEEEAKKEDIRRKAKAAAKKEAGKTKEPARENNKDQDDESDGEMVDPEDSEDEDVDMRSTTTGSFIKVNTESKEEADNIPEDDDEEEPDFYDINVLAWDTACSPLHLAIVNGHIDVVKELVQTFGADVLLPIKLLKQYDKSPRAAILTLVLALQLPLEEAKSMAKVLLELGASSAQADMNQTSALQYVAGLKPELLETLFDHDEPAAKKAINHLAVTGSTWNPAAKSPLMTAIEGRNVLGALKMLEAGANPKVDFDAWMKSVQVKFEDVATRDSKRNNGDFLKSVEQPVILAVQTELPSVVLELLARGADINTLTKVTQNCVENEWQRRYNKMESLLDLVQAKLQDLRNYKGEDSVFTFPEVLLIEGKDYLKDIEKDTYKYFVASIALKKAKEQDKISQENHQQTVKEARNRKGVAEKKKAVQALIVEFQELEAELMKRGAKTCKELLPDLVTPPGNDLYAPLDFNTNKPKLFNIEFNFDVHDLTDEKREGYLKLYEAAWIGDAATLKSLTLAPWGPNTDRTPLKISVSDSHKFTPFSIAVLRGHLDLAKVILEITQAQYKPKETKGKERYNMASEDSDYDESDMEDDDRDGGELHVRKEIVDDQFTIDNIGEISTQVKSHTTALDVLGWHCPVGKYAKEFFGDRQYTCGSTGRPINAEVADSLVQFSILANDMDLFTFLLNLKIEYTRRFSKDGSTNIPSFSTDAFEYAIRLGRLPMLAAMIKHTGAGMALEALVKKSGVKIEEKPKYYQGLSVHGKKRADWAAALRGVQMQSVNEKVPPPLEAAFQGSIDSVEWFLSDSPMRHYQEFAEANKADKRLQHLAQANGGFDKVLCTWLGARSGLILHCAVLSEPTPDSARLLEYLIKVAPESLHTKSAAGHTPLALAFSLRRETAARVLIAAGADQTTRDHKGNNLLHILLCNIYNGSGLSTYKLQSFLSLLEPRLHASLLVERSQDGPGAASPLAKWLHVAYNNTDGFAYYNRNGDETKDKLSILRTLLDFSGPDGYKCLELLDGAGDTPLHQLVKMQAEESMKMMLERRPDLMYRENATGRTPAEMAEDAYVAERVKDVPSLPVWSVSGVVGRTPESFVEEAGAGADGKNGVSKTERVWIICREGMVKVPGRRRLVSLFEANEVAKRLATRQTAKRNGERRRGGRGEEDGEGGEEERMDEVELWYLKASGWDDKGIDDAGEKRDEDVVMSG
ncbi:ankyrin repeat protein [Lepidopterella palustris CBS 459.81]|uniref:Ankyrin repeat protein n=1 Tax=Lepidopterella palustris CBS 459.81 TaxID=1314670 RepID=A0A8E2EBH1_9PEZI|nr:ankyrin repeat protein [Lepidopterella palustris CBS 459.81]